MQYHLMALLGVGTFSEVWRATRLRNDGTRAASDVALKIGLWSVEDPRSQDERAALYQMLPSQHEGVITILDITEHSHALIVAMELAETNLHNRRMHGGSVIECLRHIGQVAITLDDLHSRGVIHGGINPTDLLIVNGRAKIGDIGPVPKYATPVFIPVYKSVCMAPELSQGKPGPASDQFSLAATYAWLRTMDGAFSDSGGVGGRRVSIDISRLPRHEKEVLLTAFDPQPSRRFASCRAFADALSGAIESAQVEKEKGTQLDSE